MITYLIEALQAAGLTPTAEELADLLWLASHMGTPTFVKAETALANRQPRPNPTLPRMDDTQPAEDDDQKKSAVQTTSEENTQTGTDVYLPPTGNESGDETGNGGLPFRSPGATGLPGALDIGRALRPLKRRVPARTQFVLDEEATVRRIVDMNMDNWLPVMRPAPARWLDVVLVVDEASSMVLWRQTIAELRRLLEQIGAFRTIQIWHILPDVATGQVSLSPDLRMSKARIDQRSAAELRDPSGQRLILVLSDCVAPYWYSGEIARWLGQWGQDGLVAIVHMLPQQIRLRTGLVSATAVHVRSHLPGLRNAQLEIEWSRRRRRNQQLLTGIPIPVVTLEPETLAPWARLLAGNGKLWLPAVVFPKFQITDLHPNDINRTDLSEQLPPEKQVEQFLATASPLARELAGYFAAVPLSLPVMRLVQRVMLPQSRQVHLAEVLLSGLIKQEQVDDLTVHSDDIRYDFLDGVRDLLLDTTLNSNTIGVLSLVSKFVDEHTGKLIDFQALIEDPTLAYRINLNETSRPFATLAIRILQRFGGKYSQLAQSLTNSSSTATPTEPWLVIFPFLGKLPLADQRYFWQRHVRPWPDEDKTGSRHFADRTPLVLQDEPVTHLYAVLDGVVEEVARPPTAREPYPLQRYVTGDAKNAEATARILIGIYDLFYHGKHSTSALAYANSALYQIDASGIDWLMARVPEIGELLTPFALIERLRTIPLLAGITPVALGFLADECNRRPRRYCIPGEIVYQKNERALTLYLIDRGQIYLEWPDDRSRWLGNGDAFGLLDEPTLDEELLTHRAVATKETALLEIPRAAFRRITGLNADQRGIAVLSQRNAMTPELHRQLRTLLAELYPTRADLTRMAYDAGIPLASVSLGSSTINDWDAVLHEATKQQIVDSLLDVMRQEYPNQPILATISGTIAASRPPSLVASLPASNIHLLNFTRSLTTEQTEQIEMALGKQIGKLVHLPVEFDNARPYGPQCIALADQVGLNGNDWTTLPIVVNPPGYVPGALALFSELHGRMGYFPAVVRLRPVVGSTPAFYEVAEIINLQALRDAARERRKHRP
jgi:CRP-like cAMP-binding protein